jgi:hypothetical protein
MGKLCAVEGCECQQGCEVSRLSHFLDSQLTDGDEVVNLMPRLCFTPWRFLVLIAVRGWVNLGCSAAGKIVAIEKLSKLIRNRTRDLPAYGFMSQSTTLSHDSIMVKLIGKCYCFNHLMCNTSSWCGMETLLEGVTFWKNMPHVGPPLWSSGQSSWLQIRRPGFDSRHYQKKKNSGSGTGSTQPREFNWGASW